MSKYVNTVHIILLLFFYKARTKSQRDLPQETKYSHINLEAHQAHFKIVSCNHTVNLLSRFMYQV